MKKNNSTDIIRSNPAKYREETTCLYKRYIRCTLLLCGLTALTSACSDMHEPLLHIKGTTADLQLYMDITFTYKGGDYNKFCPVQDLHSFTQGYQTNLYICVNEPKQPISFSGMSVDGWTSDETENNHTGIEQ